MNRVTCSKPRLADTPPPIMPAGMAMTLPEFMGHGQKIKIEQALDEIGSAASYRDVAVDVSMELAAAARALNGAIDKINRGDRS